jgi:hypothetical protein
MCFVASVCARGGAAYQNDTLFELCATASAHSDVIVVAFVVGAMTVSKTHSFIPTIKHKGFTVGDKSVLGEQHANSNTIDMYHI